MHRASRKGEQDMSALLQVFQGMFEVALYIMLIGVVAGVGIGFLHFTGTIGIRIVEAIRSVLKQDIK